MAFTTMHFAVGMACGGALGVGYCAIRQKGWRWIPLVQTLAGVWALGPDLPRMVYEDFYGVTPKIMHQWAHFLHHWLDNPWCNIFFFHNLLDSQPNNYTLAGFALVLIQYNLALVAMMFLQRRARNRSLGAWNHMMGHKIVEQYRQKAQANPTHSALGNASPTSTEPH